MEILNSDNFIGKLPTINFFHLYESICSWKINHFNNFVADVLKLLQHDSDFLSSDVCIGKVSSKSTKNNPNLYETIIFIWKHLTYFSIILHWSIELNPNEDKNKHSLAPCEGIVKFRRTLLAIRTSLSSILSEIYAVTERQCQVRQSRAGSFQDPYVTDWLQKEFLFVALAAILRCNLKNLQNRYILWK